MTFKLYPGDDSQTEVTTFCKTYELNPSSCEILREYVVEEAMIKASTINHENESTAVQAVVPLLPHTLNITLPNWDMCEKVDEDPYITFEADNQHGNINQSNVLDFRLNNGVDWPSCSISSTNTWTLDNIFIVYGLLVLLAKAILSLHEKHFLSKKYHKSKRKKSRV